jgi:heme O synthase-like polyprenyltransferase
MVHYLCNWDSMEGNVYYKLPLIPLCRGLVFSSISPCIMVLFSKYLNVLVYSIWFTDRHNQNIYVCV